MKCTIILLISLLILNSFNNRGLASVPEINSSPEDSIKVLSTPDLYNLSVKWSEEYKRIYPDSKIKVISVSDSKMADNLIKEGNIGFVSDEYYTGLKIESITKVVVGRDVIIPVINSKNPFLTEISEHGISPENLTRFFKNPGAGSWGDLLKNDQNSPLRYYWINDESLTKGITEFLNADLKKINGKEVENEKEMISMIQKDPYAFGFCKMVNILDFNTQSMAENIKLLPIDRNGNGIIDYNEKIYDDLNIFSRGVWIGKYPKTLYSNIYSVSSNQTENEAELAFLKWVITDGQKFLYNIGYSELLVTERQTTVDKLSEAKIYTGTITDNRSILKTGLIIFMILLLVWLIVDILIRYLRHKKIEIPATDSVPQSIIDENSLIIPEGLYFDKTHTWAFMEQNGIVKVGIDDFLQHITGKITRIKMRNKGEKVKKGDQILSIVQNGKQLNLYAPVSGIINEQNKILDVNSSIINTSPYNDGWIYKIEPTNWLRENQLLFMADKQKRFIKHEFSRLKDFLAGTLKADSENYAQVILQDGGELRDSTLSNLGPEVWEDFQTKFIDPSRQVWFYEMF
jgi:glycine cleavage system H lipoate-binding protein/ABC-type phosphate transport system substrate-binding protein